MDQNLSEQPLVSIMMTSYNRADLIALAIESVLAQTYKNWELIILDDASTDNSANVVNDFCIIDPRIIYVPTPQNLGITKNRNRGFSVAKGKYIAVLDSDDVWNDVTKLERQVAFLENEPEYVLVGTLITVMDQNGTKTGEVRYATDDQSIRTKMLLRNQFTHSAVLIRREALPSNRPYDETGAVSIWEDYDLFLRLGLKGKFANLPEFMTAYRWHGGNISKAKKKEGAWAHLSIIKRYRDKYPHYFLGRIKGWLRLVLAVLF